MTTIGVMKGDTKSSDYGLLFPLMLKREWGVDSY